MRHVYLGIVLAWLTVVYCQQIDTSLFPLLASMGASGVHSAMTRSDNAMRIGERCDSLTWQGKGFRVHTAHMYVPI